jgi:hypothetical protein
MDGSSTHTAYIRIAISLAVSRRSWSEIAELSLMTNHHQESLRSVRSRPANATPALQEVMKPGRVTPLFSRPYRRISSGLCQQRPSRLPGVSHIAERGRGLSPVLPSGFGHRTGGERGNSFVASKSGKYRSRAAILRSGDWELNHDDRYQPPFSNSNRDNQLGHFPDVKFSRNRYRTHPYG